MGTAIAVTVGVVVVVTAVTLFVRAVIGLIRGSAKADVALEQTARELELEKARRANNEERSARDRAARRQELKDDVQETARDRDAARAALLMRAQLARLKNPKP